MKALQLFHYKARQGAITLEVVVWQLPSPSRERPHGLKYRLHCGDGVNIVVRYDNETAKGDHRHVEGREEPYRFATLEALLDDFRNDCARLAGWRWV